MGGETIEQLRTAALQRHTFDGCADDAETDWRSLAWDIDAPPGTHAAFFVRSADSLDELADAPWQAVANCIDAEGCMEGSAITGQTGKYLEVEVRLTATDETAEGGQRGCGYVDGESVRVRNITVTSGCSGRIG